MDTPYQWTKQVASHWGGTRNGTIVHWPNGFDARGEVRSQFHHVIDVAPTVLEAAEAARIRPSSTAWPSGRSRARAWRTRSTTARRRDTHTTQYFEMFVNRGIYHEGWTAVTRHSIPWDMSVPMPALDDDVWELYGPDDWTQANDLAASMPDKLQELQRLFILEGSKYNVFPLDDRRVERFNSDLAGRPTLITGKSQLLFGGMGRLAENCVVNMKNKSHSVTAQIEVPDGGASGVLARPGRLVRRVLALPHRRKAGLLLQPLRPAAVHRAQGERPCRRASTRCAWSSPTTVAGSARAATSTLVRRRRPRSVPVGSTRPCPMLFSGDETTDVGSDTATPVSRDYGAQGQHLHRPGALGAARHRRGRRGPRPPHHRRGAPPHRHGPPVAPAPPLGHRSPGDAAVVATTESPRWSAVSRGSAEPS